MTFGTVSLSKDSLQFFSLISSISSTTAKSSFRAFNVTSLAQASTVAKDLLDATAIMTEAGYVVVLIPSSEPVTGLVRLCWEDTVSFFDVTPDRLFTVAFN